MKIESVANKIFDFFEVRSEKHMFMSSIFINSNNKLQINPTSIKNKSNPQYSINKTENLFTHTKIKIQ